MRFMITIASAFAAIQTFLEDSLLGTAAEPHARFLRRTHLRALQHELCTLASARLTTAEKGKLRALEGFT
jgi:hypothetical protein